MDRVSEWVWIGKEVLILHTLGMGKQRPGAQARCLVTYVCMSCAPTHNRLTGTSNLIHLLQHVVFQPLKHCHSQVLDFFVRDRNTQMTKLEFLEFIQQIRKKAFKESTRPSAFKKTSIMPFNPSLILEKLRDRRAVTPPDRTASQSSPFTTPLTIRWP